MLEARAPAESQPPVAAQLPLLYHDRAFWGLTISQFLGAFNDNLFKQLLLLLLVAVPTAGQRIDLQFLGTLAFSLPFILFSGYAGYLSDRYSKRTVIVLSKVAEVAVMGCGALLLWTTEPPQLPLGTMIALLLTLFCMGTQSAFFGPGKYGILPELLRDKDLPRANGLILMTTFLAVILGSALAGELLKQFPQQLWVSGCVCIVIAMVGTAAILLVRRAPASYPGLRFHWDSVAVPRQIRSEFRSDPPLWNAVLASTVFWLAASMVLMAVNSLGIWQLRLDTRRTSLMVAATSVGIALGSVVAGNLSRKRFNTRVMKTGAWGLVVMLTLLALPGFGDSWQTGLAHSQTLALVVQLYGAYGLVPAGPLLPVVLPEHTHLLGYYGSSAALVVLGIFTGMFAVPLQVFMQARPPAGLKGRMIGTQNLLNWIGISLSAPLYGLTNWIILRRGWPPSASFAVIAALMLGVALLYRPREVPLAAD